MVKKSETQKAPLANATDVKNAAPGLHKIAGLEGLYLNKTGTGGSWLWFYKPAGTKGRKEMGLGLLAHINLATAKVMASEHNVARAKNKAYDPLAAREQAQKEAGEKTKAETKRITFEEAVDKYLDLNARKWKHLYARQNWLAPVKKYAHPEIGAMLLDDIDVVDVTRVTDAAITAGFPGVAKRVRQRIARVLEFAGNRGFRNRKVQNPARDGERIEVVTENYRAVAVDDAPAVLRRLRELAADDTKIAAWVFMIATATRPMEALQAKWSEVDFEKKIWTVAAHRVKGKKGMTRPFDVPLSPVALEVLELQATVRASNGDDAAVFPGPSGSPFSRDPVSAAPEKMGIDAGTPHSWRSINRRWAAAIGNVPYDIAEATMNHRPPPVVRAYLRDVPAEARRPAMDAYAKWLLGVAEEKTPEVIAFPKAA